MHVSFRRRDKHILGKGNNVNESQRLELLFRIEQKVHDWGFVEKLVES